MIARRVRQWHRHLAPTCDTERFAVVGEPGFTVEVTRSGMWLRPDEDDLPEGVDWAQLMMRERPRVRDTEHRSDGPLLVFDPSVPEPVARLVAAGLTEDDLRARLLVQRGIDEEPDEAHRWYARSLDPDILVSSGDYAATRPYDPDKAFERRALEQADQRLRDAIAERDRLAQQARHYEQGLIDAVTRAEQAAAAAPSRAAWQRVLDARHAAAVSAPGVAEQRGAVARADADRLLAGRARVAPARKLSEELDFARDTNTRAADQRFIRAWEGRLAVWQRVVDELGPGGRAVEVLDSTRRTLETVTGHVQAARHLLEAAPTGTGALAREAAAPEAARAWYVLPDDRGAGPGGRPGDRGPGRRTGRDQRRALLPRP